MISKKIEKELDDLTYVISHILKAPKPNLVEMNQRLLVEMATYLQNNPRWELKGWLSKDGRNVELDLVEKRKDEYLTKLRQGEWRSLLFQDKYSKLKLTMGLRIKLVDVLIRKRFYNPGQKRDLRPTFDELSKGIKVERLSEVNPSSADEAGILRAYTERRGVMATIKLERNKGKEAFDQSYEFHGYDVKSDSYLIEVKAFKDSMYKAIQLTENEYETMNKEENYCIYVVEDAWDDIPKINMIYEPKRLLFVKQSRTMFETRASSEEYFDCSEDKWRSNVATSEVIQV